ncbi:MAG: PilW family protein [Burkholderiaceae bacterium]|nr:PilW family protein [Burkholderiaceae bacterium]
MTLRPHPPLPRLATAARARQRGLTLVELMVAMAISLLVTLAAIGALIVTRQGFTAVDASSQLRDNGRFTADLLQRLGGQAGYLNALYVMEDARLYGGDPIKVAGKASDPEASVMGVNNASWAKGTDFEWGKTATSESGSSDILVFRFLPSTEFTSSGKRQTGMIACDGNAIDDYVPKDMNDSAISVLYVAISNDSEPALMCAHGRSATNGGVDDAQPLIQGVENFQVLYGVDRVTPNTATVPATGDQEGKDDAVPDRYLRADQITVSGDTAATNANWRRVRSIRIGMVLRGPIGSAADSSVQTFYPFGTAKAGTGTVGSAFASASDAGTIFTPTPDGRLRQVVTFTIHLRNDQKHGL